MFKQDGIEVITVFNEEWIKDLTPYSANNNANFQDSLLIENIVYLLESAKEITKWVWLETKSISYILSAIRSLPKVCFTEHAKLMCMEWKLRCMWEFGGLLYWNQLNFSIAIFLDPRLKEILSQAVSVEQQLSKNIPDKIICEDIFKSSANRHNLL